MVPKITKILFASDLSENSRHAFQYASSLAARYGGEVVLLHVIEKMPAGVHSKLDLLLGEGATQRYREAREQEVRNILIGKKREDDAIRKALAEFYGATGPDAETSFDAFEIVIKEGDAAEETIELSAARGCDLIVIGSHKGLLRATAISNVAKGLLHRSKVPVLVVPPPEEG